MGQTENQVFLVRTLHFPEVGTHKQIISIFLTLKDEEKEFEGARCLTFCCIFLYNTIQHATIQ